MVKWGAVVERSDRDALIDYLSSNFGTDRPAVCAAADLIDKNCFQGRSGALKQSATD